MEFIKRCRYAMRESFCRSRALLVLVIAGAMIATISPLVAGTANAATASPANEPAVALLASQPNLGSVNASPGCKVARLGAPDTDQQELLRVIDSARRAGLAVTSEERSYGDTTATTYAISGTSGTPASHPSAWWMYITYVHAICGGIAQFYYDFSANLNKELVKAAAKGATKISVYLGALASILAAIIPNSKVVVIIAVVSGILAVVGMNLKKWYKLVKKYFIGNGKHTGWFAHVQESLIGNDYVNDGARSCAAGWWTLKCGSTGHLWPQEQE